MALKNTEASYGSLTKFFHWTIGVLIIGMLAVGLYMDTMEASPLKFQIYGYHKATGIAVLALVVLRLIWRIVNTQPKILGDVKTYEKALAHIAHYGLYVCMIGMPLSGWVMSSAGNHPFTFFGLFQVPMIVEPNKDIGKIAGTVHHYLGYATIGIIGLHLAGVIKHVFIYKDGTLKRMLPSCPRSCGKDKIDA